MEDHDSTRGTGKPRFLRANSIVATSLAVTKCAGPAWGVGSRAMISLRLSSTMEKALLYEPSGSLVIRFGNPPQPQQPQLYNCRYHRPGTASVAPRLRYLANARCVAEKDIGILRISPRR